MIKRLTAHIGEFKRDTILAPASVIIEVVLEVLLPVLMASVIDQGVEAGNMNYVVKMGVLMLVVAMLSLLAGTLSGIFAAKASMGFGRNLRKAMYDNIQDFAFRNGDPDDDGCDQCAECVSDDHKDVRARTDHDGVGLVHVCDHQSKTVADLSGGACISGVCAGLYHQSGISHL